MKILATLLEPDDGSAQINGIELVSQKDKTRKMLGYFAAGVLGLGIRRSEQTDAYRDRALQQTDRPQCGRETH
jgi:ABC-type Na+ transport system ATPase subunit NatA